MSATVLAASVALVCWVPMAALSGELHPGGMVFAVAVGTLALAGFALAIHFAAEALHHLRLSRMETRWEHEREIRPKP